MQKTSTKIFIIASVIFGIIGIALVFSAGPGKDTVLTQTLIRALFATAFVILPSFALSVASKYLK